jgi:hypothetical protein
MISLQPTELFKQDEALARSWRDEVRKRAFHEAATYTLAKIALDGASTEQLAGAKKFLQTFMNCAEPVEAISVARPPTLDYEVEAKVAARNSVKKE